MWELYEIQTFVSIKFYRNMAILSPLCIFGDWFSFMTTELSICGTDLCNLQSLKYHLSGSLQKEFANPD